MSTDVLQKVHDIVKQSPHSAQALMLFALTKTLDTEQGNHLYTLGKLKDLTADNRQLAYQLIELMGADLPWSRIAAARALADRGAASVPIFQQALLDEDWRVVRAKDGETRVRPAFLRSCVQPGLIKHAQFFRRVRRFRKAW